jgi:integrase
MVIKRAAALAVPKRHQKVYILYIAHLRKRRKGGLSPYDTYARRFLQFAADRRIDRAAVVDFMQQLVDQKYKSQSRRFIWGVLKSMFVQADIPWPFRHGEAPRFEHDDNAPALDPRAVLQMIKTARAGKLLPEEAACLAMVTVYGLRSIEITQVRAEHFNWQERLLTIKTAKMEAPRLHTIPPEIVDVLRAWGFKRRLGEERVAAIWYELEQKSGIERVERVGWHSVRRTLDTLLREKLNATIVQVFLGWSMRGSSDMSARYHRVTFVGWGKQEAYQPQWRRELDQTVFDQHPFVKAWEK